MGKRWPPFLAIFRENTSTIQVNFEIKETTKSASYLDCFLYMDNETLSIWLYDKRDDFNFPMVNFPFLGSNIP